MKSLLLAFSLLVSNLVFAVPVPQSGSMAKHTCIVETGALLCWGLNDEGQLGTGNTLSEKVPVKVIEKGVLKVSLGEKHTCATLTGGMLKCWGKNDDGQIGDNSTTSQLLPKTIVAAGVTDVSAGSTHSCAVFAKGEIKCWGNNDDGQLGNSTTVDSLVPVRAFAAGGTQVSAGGNHTCAVILKKLRCWGSNDEGQFGNSTTDSSTSPVLVNVLDQPVQKVTAGRTHTCVIAGDLLENQRWLHCAGKNNKGQIGFGDPSDTPNVLNFEAVLYFDVFDVVIGEEHTCALFNSSMKCWGSNQFGKFGNGTTVDILAPTTVTQRGVSGISSGSEHVCFTRFGLMSCAGLGTDGQLGDNTESSSDVFVSPILQ